MTITAKTFETERDLADYLDSLNDLGLAAEVPVMDSSGIATLVSLTAPGGDGWEMVYYAINDGDTGTIQGEFDGGYVKPSRSFDGYSGKGWEPTWPVFGLVNYIAR